MAFDDCVRTKVDNGEVEEGRAERMLDDFDEAVEQRVEQGMGQREAKEEAAQDVFGDFADRVTNRKNHFISNAKAAADRLRNLNEYFDGQDPGAAYQAMIEYDPYGMNQFGDVAARYKYYTQRFHIRMNQLLEEQAGGIGGLRTADQKAQMRNFVRELYHIIKGEGEETITGDEAAHSIARAWIGTDKFSNQKYIDAGGSLHAREDFLVPQHIHGTDKINEFGEDEWVDFVKSRNVEVRDYNSGNYLEGEELDRVLREIYDNIVTEGRANSEPGIQRSRILGESRTDHRVLEFQNADSWLEYYDEFGENDILDIIISHLDSKARDIAQMEIFGANVRAGKQFVKDMALRMADDLKQRGEGSLNILDRVTGKDIVDKTKQRINRADNMHQHFRGDFYQKGNTLAGESMAGLRNTLVSAQMGTAQLWATTDLGYSGLTAKFNGLPAARTMGNIIKNMSPAREFDRAAAGRSGLIADLSNGMSIGARRWLGFMEGPAASKFLSNLTIQLSHLNRWTRTSRWSFGMEMIGHTADMSNRSWDELGQMRTGTVKTEDGVFRRALERYGINEEDWEIIRSANKFDEQGHTFIRVEDVAEHPRADEFGQARVEEAAKKYSRWLTTETQYAVPTTSLRGRSFLIGDAQRGTFIGELSRSIAMYKSFPMTMYYTHLTRMMTQTGGFAGAFNYALGIATASTLIGGMANQLNQVASGRDPRDMSDPHFWMQSFVRGGGGGLFADYLLEDVNRFGEGFATTFIGPVGSFANDSYNFTIGNVREMAAGENPEFGKEFTKNLKRYFPGGNIFYTKLALERGLHDTLEKWLDPDGYKSMRRQQEFFKREMDQDFWWEPGEATPSRAPDPTAAAGGS